MSNTGIRKAALWATTILSLAAPAVADAQKADSGKDIIVTSRRREERLQDVPLAVTAVSGVNLEKARITDLSNLQNISPSLVTSGGLSGGRNYPIFSIRGQSQQENNNVTGDPSVAVYFGDIVYARQQGVNASFFDIGTVEVLKGPQGTLFGRNVTGGAITIRPNLPSTKYEGKIGVTAGNLGTYELNGMVNLPLGDKAQLRLAGVGATNDGFITDVLTGDKVNDQEHIGLRGSLSLEPTDGLKNTTVVNYFKADDGMAGGYVTAIAATTASGTNGPFDSAAARGPRNYPTLASMLAAQQARGFYQTASGVPGYNKAETYDIANTTTYALTDTITVKNILGYRNVESQYLEDTDGLPIPLLQIQRDDHFKQYSEEFQLLGDQENLNWILGGYYFHESGRAKGFSVQGAVDPGAVEFPSVFEYLTTAGAPAWAVTDVGGVNDSYALFGQGTLKLDSLLKGFSVTAGLRQNWDDREASFYSRTATTCRFTLDTDNNPATPEVNPGLAGCSFTAKKGFDELTWNLSAEYRFADSKLLYVASRHGYRTGGFGARAATQQGLAKTFNPETVDDIEIGAKADWSPGGMFLRTNLALYTSDYKDMQRFLLDPATSPPTTVTVNAASATIQGAEFEFDFRPADNFGLSGFYSYTDASFDKFITPAGQDLTSSEFARAPKSNYSVTARLKMPVPESNGEMWLSGTYYHSDKFNISDDVQPLRKDSPAYDLANFNIDWTNVLGAGFDANVFVNNAFEEEYTQPYTEILALGYDARVPAAPRTYGVRLSYKFGE